MRKALFAAAVVFVLAFAAGMVAPVAQGAGGGGGSNCYFTCDCNGVPLECCQFGGQTYCQVTSEWNCPQGANC